MADYTQDANCEAAYLFTEGSGGTLDNAEGTAARDGTISGADWSADVPSFGISGSAAGSLLFDRNQDYVSCGTFDPSAGDLTIVFWAKWNDLGTGHNTFLSKRDSWSIDDMRWQFGRDDTNSQMIIQHPWSSNYWTGDDLTVDTWVATACVFDYDTSNTLYFNGISKGVGNGTDPIAWANDTAAAVTIGNTNAGDWEGCDSYVTEVALFSRTLSSTEINDIMDNGLVGSVEPQPAMMTTNTGFWGA